MVLFSGKERIYFYFFHLYLRGSGNGDTCKFLKVVHILENSMCLCYASRSQLHRIVYMVVFIRDKY